MGGPSIPEGDRGTVKVRISRETHRWLRDLARRRKTTIRSLVERALRGSFTEEAIAWGIIAARDRRDR